MDRIAKRIVSTALVLGVTLASACGGIRIQGAGTKVKTAQAAETIQYVSCVKVSNASDKTKAEKELGDGFTVLDTDFGKSAGTHAWIGYQTTDDPNKAITDLKVMDMEGEFNYSDYQKLLNEQKKAVDDQMEIVIPAVKEYAKCYDDGYFGAVRMYDVLNCLYEDDSEQGMGIYLLNAGRDLNQDANNNAVLDDLKKVFLQGSDDAIQTIENLLTQAQGNKQKQRSWLERMSKMGPDGLKAEYKKAYPKAGEKKIEGYIKKDLDDPAKRILENLPAVREMLSEFENSELGQAIESGDADAIDAAIDKQMDQKGNTEVTDSMSDEESTEAFLDSVEEGLEIADGSEGMVKAELLIFLKALPYGDGTSMYDFFMREDLQAEDLYPMAYLLSSGQQSLIEDVGLYGVFVSAMAAGSADDAEPEDAESAEMMNSISLSVYEGVDRGVFEGDTAITGPAITRMETSDISYICHNAFYNTAIATLCIIGIYGFWRCFDNKIVDGWYTEINTNTTYGYAKHYTACDRLRYKFNAYRDAMNAKCKLINTNEIKYQFQYLENNGYVKAGTLNMENPTIQDLKAAKYGLNPETRNRLYGKNGVLEKRCNAASKKVEEINKLIEKQNDKYISARAKLDSKIEPNKATFLNRYGARLVTVVAFAAAIGMAAYEVYDLMNGGTEKITYSDIDMPMRMVDRTYPTGSEEIAFVTYVAGLNSKGKKADLRNWKGDGWLNIYTTTDSNAGDPILAQDFNIRENAVDADSNMIAVTRFGDSDAYNVTGKGGYLFFRRTPGTASDAGEQVAEKTDTNSEGEAETGSVFGDSSMILIIVLFLVFAGGAAGAGIYSRKRKKSE